MIVESTNYFARPGQADTVLAQRLQASRIRQSLGLPRGRILVRLEGDGPDIRWECEFPDRPAYEFDRDVRKNSAEFEAARLQMHTLLEGFERHVQEVLHRDDLRG